jgi:hypothetical protein
MALALGAKTMLVGASDVGGTAQTGHFHRRIDRAPLYAGVAQADQIRLCSAQLYAWRTGRVRLWRGDGQSRGTGGPASRSWQVAFAFREPCLWNASPPNGKKPFCWVSAMRSSSGVACRAWRSTTTSNPPCSRSCKDIAGASTSCFCISTVCIAKIALFANVHAGWEKGSVENLVLCRHLTPCRAFVHTKNRCFRLTEGASEPCESGVSSSITSTISLLNS